MPNELSGDAHKEWSSHGGNRNQVEGSIDNSGDGIVEVTRAQARNVDGETKDNGSEGVGRPYQREGGWHSGGGRGTAGRQKEATGPSLTFIAPVPHRGYRQVGAVQ